MRLIVAGLRDGRSCVVEEADITPPGPDFLPRKLAELRRDALPPRPSGHGAFVEVGSAAEGLRWMYVRFPADQHRPMHRTDSIDFHTIVAGSIELVLDDGAHLLLPGDCAMLLGIDHAWNVGPEGSVNSILMLTAPRWSEGEGAGA